MQFSELVHVIFFWGILKYLFWYIKILVFEAAWYLK